MSRIGKQPIPLPKGVEVQVDGNLVKVKGPKGELTHELPDAIQLQRENGTLHVVRASDERFARAQHGLQRTLIANMVKGVSEGFEKTIELVGVGYRAQMEGKTLVLQVGYSHPVRIEPFPRRHDFGGARPPNARDADCGARDRQAACRAAGGEHPRRAPARPLQGQRATLPWRGRAPEGWQTAGRQGQEVRGERL
jgi:hypothetical protein